MTQSYSDSSYANIKRDLVVLKSNLAAQAKRQKALFSAHKAGYDENLPTLRQKLQQHVVSVADQQAQLKQLRQALKVTISRLSRGNAAGNAHQVLAEQLNAKVALRASLKRECSAQAAVRAQMQALRSGVVGAEKYADVYGARLPLEVGELNKKVDAVRRSQLGAQHGSQSAQGRPVSLQSIVPQPVANVVPLPVAQPLWHQPPSPMIMSVTTENPQNVVVRLPATEAYQAYEDGETDKALAWLKGNPHAINRHGGDGYTILFNAIESNDIAVVETLLNTSAFKPALEIFDEDSNRYNAIFEAWHADQAQATAGAKTLETMLTDYAVANGQTDVVLNAMIDIYLESFRQSFAEEFNFKQEVDRVAASELTQARLALVTQVHLAMKDIALAQTQRREDYVSDLENRARTFDEIKAALAHNGKTEMENITLLRVLSAENAARIDQLTALGSLLQSRDEAKP